MADAQAEVTRTQHRALAWAALIAVGVILWLLEPVGTGVLLGILFAITFRPMYARLARRWPSSVAALGTVLGTTFACALTFGGILWILVRDGVTLGRSAIASLGPGGGAARILASVARVTARVGVSQAELEERARALLKSGVGRAATVLQDVASTTASMVLAFFFLMLTMYFILRNGDRIAPEAQSVVPLRPEYTLELLDEFRRISRSTLLGTVVIGLLQGLLATIGYWVVGLPKPLFLGVLTAIASLVPGLGTLLVWVPASIALALLGHVAAAVALFVYGVVVLTAIPTYVILPRLVGRGGNVPSLFTFVALFGGAATLGLKGLIVGPVLMSLALATLRMYAHEHDAAGARPPEAARAAARADA